MFLNHDSHVKLLITNVHFALCEEQQLSQKREFFVIMGFKPAGLTVFIFTFLSFYLFRLLIWNFPAAMHQEVSPAPLSKNPFSFISAPKLRRQSLPEEALPSKQNRV
jgi:hypothetical protein